MSQEVSTFPTPDFAAAVGDERLDGRPIPDRSSSSLPYSPV
jgi:hypothetical protein